MSIDRAKQYITEAVSDALDDLEDEQGMSEDDRDEFENCVDTLRTLYSNLEGVTLDEVNEVIESTHSNLYDVIATLETILARQ